MSKTIITVVTDFTANGKLKGKIIVTLKTPNILAIKSELSKGLIKCNFFSYILLFIKFGSSIKLYLNRHCSLVVSHLGGLLAERMEPDALKQIIPFQVGIYQTQYTTHLETEGGGRHSANGNVFVLRNEKS